MTSFFLNHLFKDLLSQDSHILRSSVRLALQHMNLRGHSLAQDLKSFTGDLMFHLPELIRGAQVVMTPGYLLSRLGVQTPDLKSLVKPLHFWKVHLPVTALVLEQGL